MDSEFITLSGVTFPSSAYGTDYSTFRVRRSAVIWVASFAHPKDGVILVAMMTDGKGVSVPRAGNDELAAIGGVA